MNKFDDIINLSHHRSTKHPHMSIDNRAAQFASFAALTGHDEAIKETARLTDVKLELSESEREVIDRKLRIIIDEIAEKPKITVLHFVRDKKKSGGQYLSYSGCVKKIDEVSQIIFFADRSFISISDILDITGEIF